MNHHTHIKPKEVYILCTLPTISLCNLVLVDVLKENHIELYSVADDLCKMLRNDFSGDLHYQALKLDITHMGQMSSLDTDEDDLLEELDRLIEDIKIRMNQITIEHSKLRQIDLILPDTVVYKYILP
ncbi:MAG: hypothetical protein WC981_02790 [Candidatus Dojkabacteria bacterium]